MVNQAETIPVNVISEEKSLAHLLLVSQVIAPISSWTAPAVLFTLSPFNPILCVLIVAWGSLPKVAPINLISTQQKKQLHKALCLTCTCDLQLACFQINFLLVRAIVRHFVFMAPEMINSNAVFYAKLWFKIIPDIYLNTALSSREAHCFGFCDKRWRRVTAYIWLP